MILFITPSFRREATALLFAIGSLAGITNASAQTAVSNLGQANGFNQIYVGHTAGGEELQRIFSFTTGATAASFDFSGVTIEFDNANGSPTGLTVGLYSAFDANTTAGTSSLVSNLSLSSGNPTVAGNSVFSGTASILPSSTYYLKLSATGLASNNTYNFPTTSSGNEDAGGLAGWTIGNGHWHDLNVSTWTFNGAPPQFSVQASAIPEPSTYAAIAGAAMLGFAFWHRRRRPTSAATLAVNAAA